MHLLSRAGFSVDIVTTSRYLGLSRFARTVHTVTSDKALAPSAYDVVRIRTKPYDWVMATDDLTLRALAESERSCFAHLEIESSSFRFELFPVLSENFIRWRFSHASFPAMRETFPVSSTKFPVQVRREFWRNQLTYSRKN